MFKLLLTALTVVSLPLAGSAVRADSQDQRAQQHMKAYLGVGVDATAQAHDSDQGVTIQGINANSPASRAGLRRGDVIKRVGQRVIEDFADLSNAITRHQPGDRVTIQVERNGQERTFHVTLSERTARWMPRAEDDRDGQGQLGQQENQDRYGHFTGDSGEQYRELQRLARRIQRLEERLRQRADGDQDRAGQAGAERRQAYLGVQGQTWQQDADRRQRGTPDEGVRVSQVEPNSPAAEAGVREGDVITSVNGRDVSSNHELRQVVQNAGAGREVTLRVLRGNQPRELRVHLGARSADAEELHGLRRLAQRVQELEERLQNQEGDRDRQDAGDGQQIQRRIQRLENRLQELEQQRQNNRQQDQ
jgi:C-terminal processing protease CtpA/Prc